MIGAIREWKRKKGFDHPESYMHECAAANTKGCSINNIFLVDEREEEELEVVR